MSYELYKTIHLVGVFMTMLAIGGMILSSQAKEATASFKKVLGIFHGAGLIVALIAGFGALAELGAGFGGWVTVKILIWLLFGGMVAVINRKPEMGHLMLWISVALGFVATYVAILKPF